MGTSQQISSSTPILTLVIPPRQQLHSPSNTARMSVPAFSDIAKPANDLLNKDFYHLAATTLEFKDTAPNGVAFKVIGKATHEKATSAAIEGKYNDKPTGLTLTQTWNTANALDTKVEVSAPSPRASSSRVSSTSSLPPTPPVPSSTCTSSSPASTAVPSSTCSRAPPPTSTLLSATRVSSLVPPPATTSTRLP